MCSPCGSEICADVSLVREFVTRAKHIDIVLRGVNPQPPCEGELPPTLMVDAVARLTTCLTNLKIGRSRYTILAGDQGSRQGQY